MFAAIATIAIAVPMSRAESEDRPNIVVIFCDDLGYGDFSCYGHPTIRTPNVDRMAAEGLRFTQFYSAAPVCTPSRAALLTGRLPIRNGLVGGKRRVLFHDSKRGLPADEITIAEVLQGAGYATACVGKWHLGHLPPYLPGAHGFDTYFGIPYSNDMDRTAAAPEGRAAFLDPKIAYWNVPLMRQDSIIERPADQTTITRRYTEEAVAFIRKNASKPFFLYLAHSMPHVPLFRSPEFENRSPRGLFGDVVEEVDWSVGAVLDALRAEGLSEKTLVLLTSDNGPWTTFGVNGGSAGLLRGGKGSTWEGGMREPAVAWWPGRIPAGRVTAELACTTDLFATVHGLLKIPLPDDRPLDSHDITPVLTGAGPSPRRDVFYYRDSTLMAVRRGPWKMHLITQAGYGQPEPVEHAPPLLFHLEHDPGESHNVAERHPEVIDELRARIAEHRAGWTPPPSLLDD
ncbi:MAG: sulfatase [Planctomycetes bacterium]|nr:sulfatase [Planctomycetota bacterium]